MAHLDPSSDNPLSFKEKVGSAYQNLATKYANLVAYLYDPGGTLVKKWSRETQSGYETIYAPDVYTGKFYIERGVLTNYKGKIMKLEIKTIETVASRGLADDEEHLLDEVELSVGKTNMGTDS